MGQLCSNGKTTAEYQSAGSHKAVPPCMHMEFLGNTVDSEKMTIEVSQHRLDELDQELTQWINGDFCTKKKMQRIIGKLSFITNCVRPGRIFISQLLECMKGMPNRGSTPIPEETKKDLRWWKHFLPTYNGVSILWLYDTVEYDTVIATDSCLIGAGGTCEREYYHHRFTEETNHISQREILAICIALKLWADRLQGKLIRINCDNEATVTVINTGRTKDEYMLRCLREIVWTCSKAGCLIHTRFVPG